MQTVIITGGAGFIGSALVLRWRREHPQDRVVVLDALTYAGHRQNLEGLQEGPLFGFVHGDITDATAVDGLFEREKPSVLVHLAAESHVDRSIVGPMAFVQTNVVGTQVLLEAARKHGTARVVLVSTDEVYGPAPEGARFAEDAAFRPSSPYAASKASADLMAQAYHCTYGMHVTITRGANTYGPRQTPEKLIPVMITRATAGESLPVYGDGQHRRDWIHVEDHARGIMAAALQGQAGAAYNLGAGNERSNLEMVQTLVAAVGASPELIRFVTDRPAHDRRYALDVARARRELAFAADMPLDGGLLETVRWYKDNPQWVAAARAKGESFRNAWYAERMESASHNVKPVTLADHKA